MNFFGEMIEWKMLSNGHLNNSIYSNKIHLKLRMSLVSSYLFLALAVFFAIGMMVLMIKYAKFIHNQPKLEEERRQEDSAKKDSPPGDNS